VLARLPAEVVAGTAEQIPLPDNSFDVVAVAAAFHWFDAALALGEIGRVLRRGGKLAILWNERDPSDATQRALTALLEPHRRDEPRQADEAWLAAFAGDARFTPLVKRDFVHQHTFREETLVERVRSISFVATLSAERQAVLLDRVRELARQREGRSDRAFELPHITHVYLTTRR
jgi:ubiquinone/menaquinone biosynthesis C-methylase UbiE